MKKWMKAVMAAALLGAAISYAGCGGNSAGSKASGKKQVAVVQIMQHGSLDDANRGMIDGLAERGYGKDKVDVDQQNAQGDQSNLKSIVSRFSSNKPDIIFAISTPAAQAAANEIKDIPIVGCAITDFQTARLVKSNAKPETNVTGVNDRGPVEKQVDMGLDFVPGAKRMGLMYNSSEVNSEIQAEQAKKHAQELGLTVVEKTVSSVNDIQQAAESVAGSVDFIYVPTDNVLASSIPTLVKVTNAAKIPVIVGADSMAKDGALASLSVEFYKSGVQAGHMAADILDGKIKPETTAVQDPEVYEVVINRANLKALGLEVPDKYKDYAKMVD